MRNDLSLSNEQIGFFEEIVKEYKNSVEKEELLSIYRHFGYERNLMRDHLDYNFKQKAKKVPGAL